MSFCECLLQRVNHFLLGFHFFYLSLLLEFTVANCYFPQKTGLDLRQLFNPADYSELRNAKQSTVSLYRAHLSAARFY